MEEVAAILSASTSAVKVRVHDARRHIERRLKQNPAMVAVAEPRGRRGVTELRCADVEARFVDAVDGRLDPAESVRFHSHIEGCAACRERAALWRGLVPRLRDAVPPGAGGDGDPAHAGRDRAPARGPDRRVPAAALAGLVGAGDRDGRRRRGRRDLAARRPAGATAGRLRRGRERARRGPRGRSGVAGGRARSRRRADRAGGRRRRRAGAGRRRRGVRRRPEPPGAGGQRARRRRSPHRGQAERGSWRTESRTKPSR